MSALFHLLNRRRFVRYLSYALSIIAAEARIAQATSGRQNSAEVLALQTISAQMVSSGMPLRRSAILGTTFSQLQCRYLDLDYRQTFRQICQLGFDRIRLCCYWNEIEPRERHFDFKALDWLLEEAERHQIGVILAVGMKVPRWPEFHFPEWLSERYETGAGRTSLDQRSPAVADHTLRFVDAVVKHTRHAAAIQYWQIENEPFTHLEITGGRFLSPNFVKQETELVRRLALPQQKILLTGSITLPFADFQQDELALQECIAAADAVGINVYSKVPMGQTRYYIEPQPAFWQTLQVWQTRLQQSQKEAWIAEAQAEPWEPNQLVATNGILHPSSSPQQALALVHQLVNLNYGAILLWGCEYWYWHRQQGRLFWWEAMQKLVQAAS
jgi:hypothetical protein